MERRLFPQVQDDITRTMASDGEMLVFSGAEYIICSGGHLCFHGEALVHRNLGFDIIEANGCLL